MSAEAADDSREARDQKPRLDDSQYKRLKECSEKGDEGIREWNQWREEHPSEDVCLEGVDLKGLYLRGVNFSGPAFSSDGDWKVKILYTGQVYLREADFTDADVGRCSFGGAHLEETKWWRARAQNASFALAHLEEAVFWEAECDECSFFEASLEGASFTASSLCGAKLMHSDLRGCKACGAVTDSRTIIWTCAISRETDFTGTSLENARIDPITKQALEYGIRRANWEQWYVAGRPDYEISLGSVFKKRTVPKLWRLVVTFPVRLFWLVSDYGRSTWGIIVAFFGLAIGFSLLYWKCPYLLAGIKGNHDLASFVHALYFSVVTMTTLGFGDIAANPDNWLGQTALMLQVILGYLLLGALITRFAVLFAAGGPAGRFAESAPEAKEKAGAN